MFFDKLSDPCKKNIDGTVYEVSNGANVDCFSCKEKLVDIYNHLSSDGPVGTLDHDNVN